MLKIDQVTMSEVVEVSGYVYTMTVWPEDAKVESRLHFLFRV
jgi:hypothetical protein